MLRILNPRTIYYFKQPLITSFGRPGGGAPNKTFSGKLRTYIKKNPELYFHTGPSYRQNAIDTNRYSTDPASASQYQKELDAEVQLKSQVRMRMVWHSSSWCSCKFAWKPWMNQWDVLHKEVKKNNVGYVTTRCSLHGFELCKRQNAIGYMMRYMIRCIREI